MVFEVFYKKSSEKAWYFKKKQYLCIRNSVSWVKLSKKIGVWCNGNTADSGPAFPGSSPGTPTEKIAKLLFGNLAIFLYQPV